MTKQLFAKLKVFHDSTAHPAAMNMAVDEALLESATIPIIRFYRWRCPSLSFGYFGKFSDVAVYAAERESVRRWTGGGIVLHGDDLTYSIVIPAADAAFNESSIVIYEKIHRALADALNEIGEHAVVAWGIEAGSIAVSKHATVSASGYNCFEKPVHADVMMAGRKIAGAAQRRTRRGLLQQGSIQGLSVDTHLAGKFAHALATDCTGSEIDEQIFGRARELTQQKYGTDSWLRMR